MENFKIGDKIELVENGMTGTIVGLKGDFVHYFKDERMNKVIKNELFDCEVKIDEGIKEDSKEEFYRSYVIVDFRELKPIQEKDNTILFAKLKETAIIPTKREEDGAFDIYAYLDENLSFIVIDPHETKMIPTGLISAFSSDYVAILKERGSTGTKGIGQRAGVIDSGYRGEWLVPITNHNNIPLVIAKKGYNESQLNFFLTGNKDLKRQHILYPYEKAITQCVMVEVPKLSIKETSVEAIKNIPSERGDGKLGSSGK